MGLIFIIVGAVVVAAVLALIWNNANRGNDDKPSDFGHAGDGGGSHGHDGGGGSSCGEGGGSGGDGGGGGD